MPKFDSKVVLVTGSTRGLGAQIAKDFAREGALVVITGRDPKAVNTVVDECCQLSPNNVQAVGFPADITKTQEIKDLIANVVAKCGKLDVLVNNAGAGIFGSIYDDDILEKFDQMFKLNFSSVVTFTKAALPHLEKTKGAIVNMASIVASKAFPTFLPYDIAKTAVLKFSKCCAVELGPKGIRVNTVSPTAVRTGFQEGVAGENASQAFDTYLADLETKIPLRRIATPEDVSNAVLFLSSDDAKFITGQDVLIDGGQSWL